MATYSFEEFRRRQQRKPEPPSSPPVPVPTSNGTSAYARAALENETAAVARAPEGERNETLNKSTFNLGTLVAAGLLQRTDVEESLTRAALASGLNPTETAGTIRSALKGSQDKPRGVAPLPELSPNVTFTSVDQITGEISEIPFWDSREVLAHIRQFALARMTSPWAVLGVVLLRTLACIPPWVTLPPLIGGPGSLNLFCAIVGPSGVGKGATEAAATEAVTQPEDVYTAPVGSGEGIAHQYAHRTRQGVERDRDSVLFSVPEVDTLTALGNRQGATLLGQLRSAFSGERLGFGYADATRRIPIERHSYRLTMVVGVQPERAGPLLDDADGGTPQRFIWLPATSADISADPPSTPAPWALGRIRWGEVLSLDKVTWNRHIQIPDEVAAEIRGQHAARARGEGDALDGHAMFAREKVAVALAVLDGRWVVTLDDWALAGVVMRMSDLTRMRIQQTLSESADRAESARSERDARRAVTVEDRVREAAVKRVCRSILRRVQVDGIGWSELRRGLTSEDRKWFEEAIATLQDGQRIEVAEGGNGRTVKAVSDDE